MKFRISLLFIYIIIGIMIVILWPLCLAFSLLIKGIRILVRSGRSLKKPRRKNTNGRGTDVKVLRQAALSVGGVQTLFVGVQVGEFILRPDSSSQMRSDLRVEKGKTTLVIQSGPTFLLIRTKEEGLSHEAFQSQLSEEDKIILRSLASDLTGWVWPDVGEVLKGRVEKFGEDNVLRALQDLFRGTEDTMRRIRFYRRLPFIGRRLLSSIK